ncbi:MAG: hypothetical protein V7739_09220 [Motiliproteus sp.]
MKTKEKTKDKKDKKDKELDFFESIGMLADEAGSKQPRKVKNALYKWGEDFDDEKFEPLPRIFLENLDVFQFTGSELAVLIQIFMWWTNRGKWPTCFYDAIASRTGLSTRMIMDTLKRLEEKQVRVPAIEYLVVKNRPSIVYKEVKWAKIGLIKRLKYSELPPEMKTKSNKGARFFDLSNLLDICSHLINQKNVAQKGEEAISRIRQTKSSEELVYDITSSKDFKEYSRFLRKHQ